MKRLDAYVFRDMVLPFLGGTLVLALMFMLNELIAIIEQQLSSVPPTAVLQLAVLALPRWIILCLPGGLSFSIGLSVSRLMRESEMTALRSAGVRIRRVLRPAIVLSILMTALSYGLAEKVVPEANRRHDKVMGEFFAVSGKGDFVNDVPLMVGRYMTRIRSVQRQFDGSLKLDQIFMYDEGGPDEFTCYRADSGVYRDGVFNLEGARILWKSGDKVVVVNSPVMTINQKIEVSDFFPPRGPDNETLPELWKDFHDPLKSPGERRMVEASLYEQFLAPLTCILFAFMSAYSAVRYAKLGAFAGVFASSMWPWLYFALELTGIALTKNGVVPPVAGLFGGFGLFLVVCLALGWRIE